jgi:Tfp pilus assembly protein PilF
MLNNLAIVHWQQGDAAAATPLFTRAISILEREYGADHPAVANTMNNLALAYGRAGDTARAITVHRRVLALRERVLGPDHPNVGESLNNVGVLLLGRDFPAARATLERALDVRQRALPPDHPHVASTLSNLGFAHLGLGDPETARPLLERALSALDRAGERDRVMATYPARSRARRGDERGIRRRRVLVPESHTDPRIRAGIGPSRAAAGRPRPHGAAARTRQPRGR